MPRPPRLPSHLPPALAARLSADDARALDALRTDRERRHRERLRTGLPGGAECPPFLQRAEEEAPGAARLYVALDGLRFTVEGAVAAASASRLELDREGTLDALGALRRAELVTGPAGSMRTVAPGDVPF